MKLLEPLSINHMELKNRVMFPPMTTGYEAPDGSITPQDVNFYRRIAEGGTAYIVLGDVAPLPTVSPTPKLVTDEQIPSFARLADAVHEFDCKLGLQVFHPEYDTVAIAELFVKGDMQAAREKLHHDMLHYVNEVPPAGLADILASITALADRAVRAGVDAIEVHGDRLVGSLCSTVLNKREDEYGGSFENRTRFALEVVRAIRAGAPGICIDYKLPIITENPQIGRGGLFIDEAVCLAELLEAEGVDTFHVGQANHTGNLGDTIPAMGTRPYCFMEAYSRRVKEAVGVPVSTVGRIISPEDAERLINEGVCDYVGLGRALLADPDFVRKLEAGTPELIRHCIMCNKGCTDAIQSRRFISCVLNAENGYEYERVITPTDLPQRVAVVGAGPAGMEAARVAALRGHDVVLFEREAETGGQLGIASAPPRKDELGRAADWLRCAIADAQVDVRCGVNATVETVLAEKPHAVIIATGAQNVHPVIPGADGSHVLDAWKVLADDEEAHGAVVIIGGGLVGAETAEFLAQQGHAVTIVEMLDKIASEESSTVLPAMMADFEEHGVQQLTNTKVVRITDTAVEAEDADGQPVTLPCDYAVLALGSRPVTFDAAPLETAGITVAFAGDCTGGECSINNAIEAGYLAAYAL